MKKITVLAKRSDFLRIAGANKKWVSDSMIVQVAKMPEPDASDFSDDSLGIRVGYTASKRVGNAVQRNRAKRRLREVVRQLLWDKGKKGHDYVLIARTAILDMPFDQLIRDFSWCFKRLDRGRDDNKGRKRPDQGSI